MKFVLVLNLGENGIEGGGMYMNVIFWDLGNVLLKIRSDDFLQNIFEKSCSRDLDYNQLAHIITLSFNGKISLEDTCLEIINLTGISQVDLWDLIEKNWIMVNDELINFIGENLLEYHHGVVSDLWQIPYYWVQKIKRQIFYFCDKKLMFFSNLTKNTKRDGDVEYLKEILRRCSLKSENVWIVDDDRNILKKASILGMQTFHYQKPNWENKKLNWGIGNRQIIYKFEE